MVTEPVVHVFIELYFQQRTDGELPAQLDRHARKPACRLVALRAADQLRKAPQFYFITDKNEEPVSVIRFLGRGDRSAVNGAGRWA